MKRTQQIKMPNPDPSARRTQQSQTDRERGDWEGMGQSRFQPAEPEPTKPAERPSPGPSSPAVRKGR